MKALVRISATDQKFERYKLVSIQKRDVKTIVNISAIDQGFESYSYDKLTEMDL